MSRSQLHKSGTARPHPGRRNSLVFAAAAGVLASTATTTVIADDYHLPPGTSVSTSTSGPRADGHAPIGVMGDHMHKKGEWMLSYRFMNMHMDGMRSGTDDVSADEVATTANPLGGEMMRMGNLPNGQPRNMMVPPTYRISPIEMDMRMHMFGLMYAPTNNITLMAMVNYTEKEMELQTYRGMAGTDIVGRFTSETKGFGDTKLSALIRLYDDAVHHVHLNAGISLPTGSITKDGSVLPPFAGMMGTGPNELVDIDRLGYPMQLGSGTYDALPGITYTGRDGDFTWGAQVMGTIRMGENDESYKLGNVIEGTAWAQYQWAQWISTSVRIAGKSEGQIRGRDPAITGGMPLFVAQNSGRKEIDLFIGANLVGQKGLLRGHRFAVEFGGPIYEDVNGLQMSNDWMLTVGWQKAF